MLGGSRAPWLRRRRTQRRRRRSRWPTFATPGTRPGRRPRSSCRRRQMSPARPRARSPRPSRETAASGRPTRRRGAARTGATSRSMAGPGAVSRTEGHGLHDVPGSVAERAGRHSGRYIKTRRKRGSLVPSTVTDDATRCCATIRSRTGMPLRRTGSRARSPPHRARGADVMSGVRQTVRLPRTDPRALDAPIASDRPLRGRQRIRKRSGLLVPYHGMGEDQPEHRSFVEWPNCSSTSTS